MEDGEHSAPERRRGVSAKGRGRTPRIPARAGEWACRVAFAIVFAWNVQCAVQFVAWPADFAAGFQLEGPAGEAAVRGLGVAFLMWNTTYPLFIWRPRAHRVLGGVVLVQQAIGLVGELYVASCLPKAGFSVLSGSIARFVGFDAVGLVLMAAAFYALRASASAKEVADASDRTASA